MTLPVSFVVKHHQGSGAPSNAALAEIAPKGYSYGIGTAGTWQRFRSPAEDFSTWGYNHVSAGVCLTGNRDVYPVTSDDFRAMREIAADMRQRAELVPAPLVQPHREVPANSTVCPGNNVAYPDPPRFPTGNALVWVTIVGCYHLEVPPMPPHTAPEFWPALELVSSCLFTHPTMGRCSAMLTATGHVYCDPPDAYCGSPYDGPNGAPLAYWLLPGGVARAGARIDPIASGYRITATTGETYDYAR